MLTDDPNPAAGQLVYVDTADGFIAAVENAAVAHIVVVAHLDLTGLPPVDPTSLAVARPLASLKSIKVLPPHPVAAPDAL